MSDFKFDRLEQELWTDAEGNAGNEAKWHVFAQTLEASMALDGYLRENPDFQTRFTFSVGKVSGILQIRREGDESCSELTGLRFEKDPGSQIRDDIELILRSL